MKLTSQELQELERMIAQLNRERSTKLAKILQKIHEENEC